VPFRFQIAFSFHFQLGIWVESIPLFSLCHSFSALFERVFRVLFLVVFFIYLFSFLFSKVKKIAKIHCVFLDLEALSLLLTSGHLGLSLGLAFWESL
jgi:hypothetical protein